MPAPDNPLAGARFLLAAHRIDQLPADRGAEVAFAGRSNAGKSSALNALTGQSALARTSRTPGRTQQLVVFELPEARRLVDLPGYGYAKVPPALREHWKREIDAYLRQRRSLRALVLIADIRHAPAPFDRQLLGWSTAMRLPCVMLLSKADKLSRAEVRRRHAEVEAELATLAAPVQAIAFSAPARTGVDAARAAVAALLGAPRNPMES